MLEHLRDDVVGIVQEGLRRSEDRRFDVPIGAPVRR